MEKLEAVLWTGYNLEEVIEFTGKHYKFNDWFKSWEDYEEYVKTHDRIFKLISSDGISIDVHPDTWIVKTPDGFNIPLKNPWLEVKEVDLQSEIDRVWDNTSNNFLEDGWKEFEDIAKHFFELGVNTSNPLTDANLNSMQDDYVSLLESRGMKHEEAVIASVSYVNGVNDVLKRFKAQKGE